MYMVPTKIYRVGQGRTNAVSLHSSWSRNLSSFSVTVRHKPNEVQLGSNNQPDWNGYLTKKVNGVLASGRTNKNIPKFAENDEDKDREFVLTYRVKDNKFLTTQPMNGNASRAGIDSRDRRGSLDYLGKGLNLIGGGKTLAVSGAEHCFADKSVCKVVTVTGADIQMMKGEKLRVLSRDLKIGNVDVRSYYKRGGGPRRPRARRITLTFTVMGTGWGARRGKRRCRRRGGAGVSFRRIGARAGRSTVRPLGRL